MTCQRDKSKIICLIISLSANRLHSNMLLVRGSLIEQSFPTLSLKVLNIWSKISINGRQFISILSYARYEAVNGIVKKDVSH